jgi:hypothetical protein
MRLFRRNYLAAILTASSLFYYACSEKKEEAKPIDPDGFTTYVIKKGAQSSGSPFVTIKSGKIQFSVLFDSSAIYKTIDPVNQYDINKLYGLADCNTHHQQNSARMGWCWVNNQLEIHAYGYKNGERKSEFITAIPIGKPATMSIEMQDSTYLFRVNDKFAELPRGCNGEANGYKLYPYFGGDEFAPHDITIKVKDL